MWKKVVSWEGGDIWMVHLTTRLCSLPTVIEVGMLAASVYWSSVDGWAGIASFSKYIEILLMIWQLSKNTHWRYVGDYNYMNREHIHNKSKLNNRTMDFWDKIVYLRLKQLYHYKNIKSHSAVVNVNNSTSVIFYFKKVTIAHMNNIWK